MSAAALRCFGLTKRILRIIERERAAVLEKEKKAIEKELNEEIKKEYSLDFYERMTKQYPDNLRIRELVGRLKSINV